MEDHDEREKAIIARVKDLHKRGKAFRIDHGSSHTTRKVNIDKDSAVDTRTIDQVIDIDCLNLIAVVEPNVSMRKLVKEALLHELIPQVVMELPEITVGGGFAGSSGESSSFYYGLFDRTVEEINIVLPNGEWKRASNPDIQNARESRGENQDLFDAAAGSFGSFGVITLLKVRLMKAKNHVRLEFKHFAGFKETIDWIKDVKAIRDGTSPRQDYLEGILFGKNSGVVVSGTLTDKPSNEPVSCYNRSSDTWFYLKAQDFAANPTDGYVQYVQIEDYLFRHDRGAFWAGKYAFEYFKVPFNSFTRWMLDSFLRTDVINLAGQKSRMAEQYIAQDITFPYDTVEKFVAFLDESFSIYPLWLCPLKMTMELPLRRENKALSDLGEENFVRMLNVGIWGRGPLKFDAWIQDNRKIEEKTTRLGGLKCLYAHAFYSKEEFSQLYDETWYNNLREKYHATDTIPVYEKVVFDLSNRTPHSEKLRWPFRGMYGVLHVLFSRKILRIAQQAVFLQYLSLCIGVYVVWRLLAPLSRWERLT